jgi:hypothetical protein
MFVIYKENFIPGVGGIHPQGIETGLGYYNGWNLADCPESKIHNYKEFDFVAVDSQVARGLTIVDSMNDDEDAEIDVELIADDVTKTTLSDQDKLDIEAAKTFINNLELKLVTRAKVREMKDLEDDLVDIKRMAQILITFAVDDWKNKPAAEQNVSKYKSVMEGLSNAVVENVGALSSVDKDLDKINEIVDMEVEIAKVVDEYYLTKKL